MGNILLVLTGLQSKLTVGLLLTHLVIFAGTGQALAETHLWSQRFGSGSFDNGAAVSIDLFGNVVVTGWFQGLVDFGGGPLTSAGSNDIFLASHEDAGEHKRCLGRGPKGDH